MCGSSEVRNVSSEVSVRGYVIAGIGRGRFFVSLSWFRKYVKDKLGFEPYPGTLNLKIPSDKARELKEMFSNHSGYVIPSEEGYSSGRLYRALIESRVEGAIVKPIIPGRPENIIEVIAPVCLREALNLKDGDEVEVKVFFE